MAVRLQNCYQMLLFFGNWFVMLYCVCLPHMDIMCCTSVWFLRDEVNHQEINILRW
jgi:hypothetical protein